MRSNASRLIAFTEFTNGLRLAQGPRDVVLDIGFWDGESLLTMAACGPGRDYFERPGLRLGHEVRDLRFRKAP